MALSQPKTLFVAILLSVAAVPAMAHHSGAMFDDKKEVTLTGASDLYDEVTDRMLLQNVSGAQTVTIPPGSTILVIAPLTGSVSRGPHGRASTT